MLDKLKPIEQKFEDIELRLSQPEVISNSSLYASLIKEYNRISPIVEAYREHIALLDTEEETRMLCDSDDVEMRHLAEEELRDIEEKLSVSEQRLHEFLIPRDPDDDRNVIVEIRAGTGGEEAALFAADLFRMYSMYSDRAGFKINITSVNETELGGLKEITFLAEGSGAYSKFKFESGVHRVQRVPATESQGRIQTSAATVAVLPEVEDVSIEIKDSDLIYESCKSSGAGGQHINKTESAVRLTHKPTGIVIECQQERSQFQNKDKALAMLKSKLYSIKKAEQDAELASTRRSQVGSGDRSEKIRTYNYPQSRVTDHRIGFSIYDLAGFMNGAITPMLDALTAADTAERLKQDSEV